MRPPIPPVPHHVREYPQMLAALAFTIFASLDHIQRPLQYSLVVTCISWGIVWLFAIFKLSGDPWFNTSTWRRKTSWLAGALISLSSILDRAAGDKEGTWATKGLLLLLVVFLSNSELLPKLLTLPTHAVSRHDDKDTDTETPEQPHSRSYRLLAAFTISASIVLACYSVPTTTALGINSVIFAAVGLVLFETAIRSVDDADGDTTRGLMISHADHAEMPSSSAARSWQRVAVLRDVAMPIMVICGIATCTMAAPGSNTMIWAPPSPIVPRGWYELALKHQVFLLIPVNVFLNFVLFVMICRQGAVITSLLVTFPYLCAKSYLAPSFTVFWFIFTFGLSAFVYTSTTFSPLPVTGSSRIFRRVTLGITAVSVGLLVLRQIIGLRQATELEKPTFTVKQPPSPFEPLPIDLSKGHPAAQLSQAAEYEFQTTVNRQSSSLSAAVREYRRRNGIAPPPNFEKWYEFAVRNNVVMIDEFDMINEMLQPFWALKPATIRSRITRELGGVDSALLGVSIRDGAIVNVDKGDDWQRKATVGMMQAFIQHLPDMDLGFNIHDEPRVVVPTGLLSQMVSKARDEVLPRVARYTTPRNTFSGRPKDMNDGKRFTETYVSNFNRFAHQQTWTQARLSCPLSSQSQTFEDYAPDNVASYAVGSLGHLYNTTAFSDICVSPSFSSSFGFFERPNAFSVVHELTPIFSQSKISSFQDILYPSPWYWAARVKYHASEDTDWDNKTNSLYWRGSTTGGFSRNSGWRRQHRQHIVQRINAPEKVEILIPSTNLPDGSNALEGVHAVSVQRKDYKHLVDVHFSGVGQCDPSDCDAQNEFFHVTEHAEPQNAWYFKHLLDMDGNAFSGRFYSFLKSRSLTFKMAIFREWHEEWVKPWVHYVPLSLRGDEHLDLINWFSGNGGFVEGGRAPDKSGNGDSGGEEKAREMAMRSTEWHDKVLRNIDMEVWLFRLLLEYGRVIDDNREEIGYPGP